MYSPTNNGTTSSDEGAILKSRNAGYGRITKVPGGSDACLHHPIPPVLSIYFDLVRFIAAIIVVLHHTWQLVFPQSQIRFPGHEAVVVFFVLSGYVITHAASRPEMTLLTYLQHRIARIVPVAWAALLLGLVFSIAEGKAEIVPTLVNLAFIGQSGFWWIDAPLNSPYWSLSYEVWYYLIFAAWLYAPRQHRLLISLIAVLLAGPKILMLLPVWLMGVWLYRRAPMPGRRSAAIMFVITLIIAAALFRFDVSDALRSWLYRVLPQAWHAHYSTQFLYDYVLGIVVTVHFAAVSVLSPALCVLAPLARVIRYLAGMTLTLYLFHSPLREVYRAGMNPLLFYGGLALCVVILAELTERRLVFYRDLTERLIGKVVALVGRSHYT